MGASESGSRPRRTGATRPQTASWRRRKAAGDGDKAPGLGVQNRGNQRGGPPTSAKVERAERGPGQGKGSPGPPWRKRPPGAESWPCRGGTRRRVPWGRDQQQRPAGQGRRGLPEAGGPSHAPCRGPSAETCLPRGVSADSAESHEGATHAHMPQPRVPRTHPARRRSAQVGTPKTAGTSGRHTADVCQARVAGIPRSLGAGRLPEPLSCTAACPSPGCRARGP